MSDKDNGSSKTLTANLEDKVLTRFEAMDKAIQLLHEDGVRVPTLLDRAISNTQSFLLERINRLSDVSDERFTSIASQFIERDKRTDQLTVAAQTAVAAAFAAQKEAVAEQNKSSALAISKSENATAESIRQLQSFFQSESKGTNDKINDLKSRLDRGEGKDVGVDSTHVMMIAVLAMIFGAIGTMVAIIGFFVK